MSTEAKREAASAAPSEPSMNFNVAGVQAVSSLLTKLTATGTVLDVETLMVLTDIRRQMEQFLRTVAMNEELQKQQRSMKPAATSAPAAPTPAPASQQ